MSNPTETQPDNQEFDQAWQTALREVAAQDTTQRGNAFWGEMQAWGKAEQSNRPVLSPMAVILAEMISRLTILQTANTTLFKAAGDNSDIRACYRYLLRHRQLEDCAKALLSINSIA